MTQTHDERVATLREVADSLGDEFMAQAGDDAREILHNYLVFAGEPKDYRGFVELAGTITQGILLRALEDKRVTVPKKYLATDEERAERAAEREKYVGAKGVANPGAHRDPIVGGSYL